ncbi:MAG TPA: YbaL family putative K(+) efflux transporter [Noviherbaspirillum sp.]|uniref:YbaL family putative K(+) efflux transporter n=1 Tax=Noviherbaspirillum sp. TaxID=1926288 RepID=UPI002D656A81|nr:YbaL family putative K(+) efflux transporter [Noviherbaspirillum sp.]HYD94698.1 YbaL family putative K(+) efflux transporter [Noviherbaspirillum sp.]
MHHNVGLIATLAAAFGLALVFGFLTARFKLPALVGYLLAGIVLGPFTPGFIADTDLATQLAEIGVMLLMFGVGLHFSLDDLMEVKKIALPGAVLQIGVATLLGLGIAMWLGWSFGAGLVFGLCLSVASTVVLLRALEERGALESMNGRIAVGWLVVEDLAMVLVLVLLPALSGWLGGETPNGGGSLWNALLVALGQVTIFISLMLVVGRKVFPWLLWQVAKTNSRELFTLCVIAAAIGIAYGSSKLFGVSFALGAFFAGMVLRESELSHRAATESLPLQDAFSVLFFVSVGMLFNPAVLVEKPLEVLAVVFIIIFGKSLAAFLLVLLLRYPLNTALTVSASLAQIGEFSFILVALGLSLGLLPAEAQSLVLAGAILSIALNPFMFKAIGPVQSWLQAHSGLARKLNRRVDPLAELPMAVPQERLNGQVVLVGYGRVGRRIAADLKTQGVPYVVVEDNREIVQRLRQENVPAVAGNAAEPDVLIQAHIARAAALVIATPDTFHVRAMVEIARTLNPKIETIVRTHSDEEAELLRKEHAGQVFMGEHELARGMSSYVLKKLKGEGQTLHETSHAAAANQ